MKSRLSSTIWALVLMNGVVGFIVLGLAFSAGKKAGDASLFDFGSPAGGTVLIAIVLALATAVILAWRFGAMLGPVQALAEFSERMAAGDPRARAEVHSTVSVRRPEVWISRCEIFAGIITGSPDATKSSQ